ncbi:hypothetical protein ACIRRH_02985 [Kitasatospora sp. NPDC101235]|uniref:hypothetical protein n=1 Tax=Kitasatospora sp. NPDC101235 TaxID=3364101 RepID=UPI00382B81CD
MPTRRYGRTTVTLPDLDNDPYLGVITSPPRPGSTVTEFRYTDQDLRDLDLTEADLRNGILHNITAQRTTRTSGSAPSRSPPATSAHSN